MSGPATLRESAATLLSREGLNPNDAPRLVRMLARAQDRTLAPGEALFTEGAPGDSMAILLEGQVRVTSPDAQGAPRELAVLDPPILMGYATMIEGATRSATVEAVGPARVISIPHSVYTGWLNATGPDGDLLRDLLLGCMFRQLARTTEDLQRLMTLAPKG